VELNAHPRRLDLDWRWCRRALAQDVAVSIGPDAHRAEGLDDTLIGVGVARKGWLGPGDVLNTRTAGELREHFDRRRRAWRPERQRSRWNERGERIP